MRCSFLVFASSVWIKGVLPHPPPLSYARVILGAHSTASDLTVIKRSRCTTMGSDTKYASRVYFASLCYAVRTAHSTEAFLERSRLVVCCPASVRRFGVPSIEFMWICTVHGATTVPRRCVAVGTRQSERHTTFTDANAERSSVVVTAQWRVERSRRPLLMSSPQDASCLRRSVFPLRVHLLPSLGESSSSSNAEVQQQSLRLRRRPHPPRWLYSMAVSMERAGGDGESAHL